MQHDYPQHQAPSQRPAKALGQVARRARQPTTRADHALRILLDDMAALDTLSVEDQQLLCHLDAPHGALFTWLERQFHQQGAQPWVALRQGLKGHDSEDFAVQLMAGYTLSAAVEGGEGRSELRHLLNRMLIEHLKVAETQAIAQASLDPAALLRYRELQQRRRLLEAAT